MLCARASNNSNRKLGFIEIREDKSIKNRKFRERIHQAKNSKDLYVLDQILCSWVESNFIIDVLCKLQILKFLIVTN